MEILIGHPWIHGILIYLLLGLPVGVADAWLMYRFGVDNYPWQFDFEYLWKGIVFWPYALYGLFTIVFQGMISVDELNGDRVMGGIKPFRPNLPVEPLPSIFWWKRK